MTKTKTKSLIQLGWRGLCTLMIALGVSTTNVQAQFNEVENNNTKATANAVAPIGLGYTVVGTSTGSSTVTAGITSADYYLMTFPVAAAGIYENIITLTQTGTAGHTVTIRGLVQTNPGVGLPGAITAGTDATAQTSSTLAQGNVPLRSIKWYSFGKGEQLYVRVAGTASTTGTYTLTWTTSAPVTPIAGPTIPIAAITDQVGLQTVGQTTVDTDTWIYDSNLDPVPLFGNDDEPTPGTTLQSKLTRAYPAAGTYYMAISRYQGMNNQNSPGDDRFKTGTVLDFAGAHLGSSTTNPNDFDFAWQVNAGALTPFTVNGSSTPNGYSTAFVQITLQLPSNCGSANAGTITPSTQTVCANNPVTMTSTGANTDVNSTNQWMVSATSGSGYVNVTGGSGATTTSYTTDPLAAGTYYYVLQNTCANCGPCSILSNEVTVTVTAGATPGTNAGPLTGVTYQNLNYSLTGYSPGASFQWQYSFTSNSGPWTNIGTNIDNLTASSNSGGTLHVRCVVTLGLCSANSNVISTVVTVAGDNVCSAVPLSMGLNGPFTNIGATTQVGEPVPPGTGVIVQTGWDPGQTISNSVWFTFVAPASGRVSIGNNGFFSLWDNQFALYSASACSPFGGFTLLAANDDSLVSTSPFKAWIAPICLTPGVTYYLQVDGYSTTTNGTWGLNIIDEGFAGSTAAISGSMNTCFPNAGSVELAFSGLGPWTYSLTDGTNFASGSSATATYTASVPSGNGGSHTWSLVYALDGACATINSGTATVLTSTVAPAATVALPIVNLPTYACNGTSVLNLNVPAISGATSYIWDAPAGTTFNGQNPYTSSTPSADILFAAPTSGASGYHIGVQAQNACGASFRQSQWVRNNVSVPAAITPTTATATHCASTIATFTCPAGVGATSYLWSITGDAFVSGTGTTGTVTFGPAWVGGTLSVAAQTPCFTSAAKSLVLRTSTATLGAITGSVSACVGNTLPYSVVAVDGASTYAWTYPANASGASTSNSTNATFNPGFTAGNICVQVTSVCGDVSPVKCKSITTGSATVPATLTGNSNGVCGQNNQTYTCTPQAGASFIWTLPVGASGSSTTNSISVTFSNSFTTGAISVQANNACGTSGSRAITVKGAPNTPGAITPNQVVCDGLPQIVFNSSTANLAGVYSLNWVWVPASAASYFSGQGSNALTLDWNTGNASVNLTASNACGTATRALAVTSIGCAKFAQGAVVNQESANAVAVYPNPASNLINIEYTAKSNGNVVYKLVDLTGKAVAQKAMTATEGFNTTTLDLSNLSKGIYMLNVLSSETNSQVRVVVQ